MITTNDDPKPVDAENPMASVSTVSELQCSRSDNDTVDPVEAQAPLSTSNDETTHSSETDPSVSTLKCDTDPSA